MSDKNGAPKDNSWRDVLAKRLTEFAVKAKSGTQVAAKAFGSAMEERKRQYEEMRERQEQRSREHSEQMAAERQAILESYKQRPRPNEEQSTKDKRDGERILIIAAIGAAVLLLIILIANRTDQYCSWGRCSGGQAFLSMAPSFGAFLVAFVGTTLLGLMIGIFNRLVSIAALTVGMIVMIIASIVGDTSGGSQTQMLTISVNTALGVSMGASVITLFFATFIKPKTKLPVVFGSSRWADIYDLRENGLLGKREGQQGLFLGHERMHGEPIVYDGDMHAITVAPTRTGKGATAIIPNLKRSASSMLVIDPKGENARRTATDRMAMGQYVFVVDPWQISVEADRYGEGIDPFYLAKFNPLAAFDPHDPDLASDAMLLADALVIDGGNDPFWSNEAKALLQGFILHVVTCEEEPLKTLGRVRDILCLRPKRPNESDGTGTLDAILNQMSASDHPVVRQAANRFLQKAEKERSGVVSTAQANTHFLDSPKIRDSLSDGVFRFADLKTEAQGITVYLVLPLDRMVTFNRWLRLVISAALIDLTRIPSRPDAPPVRVLLDEFPALQKLELIETAYGTMAGMGVQLWAFVQDLGQLMRLYGDKSWQTFVSNAGVFQYFGSRDYETAQYAERLCGMTTMKKRSFSFGTSESTSSGPNGGSSTSGTSETVSIDDVSRPLAYADEMMTLHRDLQLLFIENNYPIVATKHYWFREPQAITTNSGGPQA